MFKDKLVEVLNEDLDYVWIHDYHLMVLPSMLRRQFLRLRCGLFLHSPFPSSEIFRTFPMREQILRSLLNADLIGTRPALPCCTHRPALLDAPPRLHCGNAAVQSSISFLRTPRLDVAARRPVCMPERNRPLWTGHCETGDSRTYGRGRNGNITNLSPPQGSTHSTTRGTSCRAVRGCWGWIMSPREVGRAPLPQQLPCPPTRGAVGG